MAKTFALTEIENIPYVIMDVQRQIVDAACALAERFHITA
jgi:hypothetical protein